MRRKEFGKIDKASFGFGGYQECMLGLTLQFTMKGSAVGAFINGGWMIERTEYAKWSEADRSKQQAEMCMKVIEVLKQAKVGDVRDLEGIPVELEFDGMVLKNWRILEEVL